MSKSARIIKDVFLFAFANFIPKVISFFLTPLYTSKIATEAYGVADLLNTILSLGYPILSLNISVAIIIFTAEYKDKEVDRYYSLITGLRILFFSSMVLYLILGILSFSFVKYRYYFLYLGASYTLTTLSACLISYARAIGKSVEIMVSTILQSFFAIVLNVFLIICFNLQLEALLISNIFSLIVVDLYLLISCHLLGIIRKKLTVPVEYVKNMLKYSIPMIFSGIAYWVNTSSDRFFISSFQSVSENGIYAVASKTPTIVQAVQSILIQALQISILSQKNTVERKVFMEQLNRMYCFVITLISSLLIVLNKPLAEILFKNSYYIAWRYVPGLLIAISITSFSSYISFAILLEKAAADVSLITIVGAVVNTVFNVLLIPNYSIMGAVIATIIGYAVSWLIYIPKAHKKTGISFHLFKYLMVVVILCTQWIIELKFHSSYLYNIVLFFIILLLQFDSVKLYMFIGKGIIKNFLSSKLSKN